MSVNSSSSSNASLPVSLHSFKILNCFVSAFGRHNMIAYTITNNVLLLPLFIFVFSLGLRQWRQQRMMSHSDVVTAHILVAELIGTVGSTLICSGSITGMGTVMTSGVYFFINYHFMVIAFHMLTCVERYLAVVHPITYVGLRKEKGIRIRNICIGCVWLVAFTEAGISILIKESLPIFMVSFITLNLAIVSFCSLSVLRVLCRPKPGEEGGGRQVDGMKLRAFKTIFAVLGVLMIMFGFNVFSSAVLNFYGLDAHKSCVLWVSSFWFGLPSRLVIPMLFLHREGKLCCNKRSG